jgi:hypothetical protein
VSDGRQPYTLRVMHAVAESDLPPHLRHFVMTLALLANSETGRAHYGQEAIAKAMGCSSRQVRSHFRELEARTYSAVRVQRRRRGTPDGKGRSSDEWQLVLGFPEELNRKPASGSGPPPADTSTGTTLPLETTSNGSPLPVTPEPPEELNRKFDAAQPEVCDSSTGSPLPGIVGEIVEGIVGDKDTRERVVFDAWCSKLWSKVHKTGQARPTPKRLKRIRARLADGFTPEQLATVFDKVAQSTFHVSGGYIEPETIIPTREKVEWWLARRVERSGGRNGPPVVQRGGIYQPGDDSWLREGVG